jgi:hypothetical protein
MQRLSQDSQRYSDVSSPGRSEINQNIDTGSQINNLLRELKNQINILDDVQKRKSTFSNQNYIQKIENIYKEKNIELQKLKEIHKS